MKFNKNEITHIVYEINSVDDVIHRFSPKGYELLNDDFVYSQELSKNSNKFISPILTEISGATLTDEEKKTIENAVKIHYGLKTNYNNNELKKCAIKILWFFVSFVLSSALLFLTSNETVSLFIQFAYLPFWFFGYRLLTYPLFEYLPKLNEKRWNEQLATMTIVYTDEPMKEIPSELKEKILSEVKLKHKKINSKTKHNDLINNYFVEKDTVELECNVNSKSDLLSPCLVNNKNIISPELSSYLDYSVPFIENQENVSFLIKSADFSQNDKTEIKSAIKNYLNLKLEEAKTEVIKNQKNILILTAGFIISSFLLYFIGNSVDVAYHEFILILLWFFGDYLIEYVILTQLELLKQKRLWQKITNMDIKF